MKSRFDLICLGRAGVDFYAEQIGSPLEDVQSLNKYLGGSSTNIACSSSRQGLKVSLLTRVGDEHMGRFILQTLEQEGVDTSHVRIDPERLTALVVLGIRDRETFPLIFYRSDCADMSLSTEDFDEEYIASAKALLITGTHFSTKGTSEASFQAVEYAKRNGRRFILDIDYRPVLWGLTGRGEGENRFVASESVSKHLQKIFPYCDLIVGTEEEIHIGGGNENTLLALKNIREITEAIVVLKKGSLGAQVIEGVVPDSIEEIPLHQGVQVEVLNVLGAGDAFMGGFLRGWLLEEKNLEQSCEYANACGAIVVSRHACTPAMPTRIELDDFLMRQVSRPDLDTKLNYLHRVTQPQKKIWNHLNILAFDHRSQFEVLCQKNQVEFSQIPLLKKKILKAFSEAVLELKQTEKDLEVGLLCDSLYGTEVLSSATGKNWWVGRPVELPRSRPLRFQPLHLSFLKSWPKEHVVKCLVFYHPDDAPSLRDEQEQKVLELFDFCTRWERELLLEVIPPKTPELKSDENILTRSLRRFYNLGIYPNWWKLFPSSHEEWQSLTAVISERDPYCRGILLLGLDSSLEEIRKQFEIALSYPICKGFAIGRTVFSYPSEKWIQGKISDSQLIDQVKENYIRLVHLWSEARTNSK